MSKFTLVSSLLKQFLPIGLAQFATQIYTIVKSSKYKPGDVVFNFPCGHILRNIIINKCKEFFCSCDQKFYSFERNVYSKVDEKFDRPNQILFLTEYIKEDRSKKNDRSVTSCRICGYSFFLIPAPTETWGQIVDDSTFETTTELITWKQQYVCFCGKFADQFPCDARPKKRCRLPYCVRFTYKKSLMDLCKKHFRCKTCRKIFSFDYRSLGPDDEFFNCYDGKIIINCSNCKITMDERDVDRDEFEKFIESNK